MVGIGIAEDHIHIGFVLENDVIEYLHGKLGKCHRVPGYLLYLFSLLFIKPLADAAGEAEDGMHCPAAEHLDDAVVSGTGVNHCLAELHAYFGDDAQDIALGHGSFGTHDEIRSAQDIEMGGMVSYIERAIEKLAQLLGWAGRINME
jgi:hypothetical protein